MSIIGPHMDEQIFFRKIVVYKVQILRASFGAKILIRKKLGCGSNMDLVLSGYNSIAHDPGLYLAIFNNFWSFKS